MRHYVWCYCTVTHRPRRCCGLTVCGVAARVQPRPKRWLWSSEAGRSRGVLLCPAEDTQDSEEVLAVRLHRHETVEGFRRIWLRDFVVTRLERSSGRYGNVSSSSRDSKGLQVDLATCLHRHETVKVFRSIWLRFGPHETLGCFRRIWLRVFVVTRP